MNSSLSQTKGGKVGNMSIARILTGGGLTMAGISLIMAGFLVAGVGSAIAGFAVYVLTDSI